MTARSEILEAARSLTDRGISSFSPKQLIAEVERNGTRYPEETLRTHIVSWMCVDAPQHNPNYPDLKPALNRMWGVAGRIRGRRGV